MIKLLTPLPDFFPVPLKRDMKRFVWGILLLAVAVLFFGAATQEAPKPEAPARLDLSDRQAGIQSGGEGIPFQSIANLILVNGSINGNDVSFLLDTGCSGVMISKKLAQSLGLKKVRSTVSMGVKTGKLYTVDSISVDGLSAPALWGNLGNMIMSGDFSDAYKLKRAKINGAIGAPFFAKSRLTIDYREKFITISEGSGAPHKINFDLMDGLIMLNARINDSEPLSDFILDTGASATVVNEEIIPKLKLGMGMPMPFVASIDKPTFVHMVRVNSLSFGKAVLNNLTCGAMNMGEIEQKLKMAAPNTNIAGIVGYSFLSQFKITIDYPRQRLMLTPYDDDKKKAEALFTINKDTFSAKEVGVSFDRPNNTWTFVTENNPLNEMLVVLNKKDSSAKSVFMLGDTSGGGLEDAIPGIEYDLKYGVTGCHKLSGEFSKIAGQTCYITEYTAIDEGIEKRCQEVYFKVNNTLCVLSSTVSNEEFESVKPEFEKLLKSVKLR